MKQSGGHVEVESEPGRGTTFRIYLPSVEAAVPARKSEPEPTKPLRGNETVLLVEDERQLRELFQIVLQENGYNVLAASDGTEAILLSERHPGALHLLISDVVMPQVGGREVAERMAAMRPNMKVLFMSGYTDDAVMRDGILDTEANFLQKPFTPSALAKKVREVLDR